ncbi:lipoprotein [Streptomyces sp. NPDC048275]|uniref:lipoprotein n=1 Tax=Streptomyces sp. NPDC048275 TaxID=3155629 RepID=UPI0033FB1F6A
MRRIICALFTATALTGCSFFGQDAPCTLTNMDSGAAAVWRPADFGGPDEATIRLCVDDTCKERTSGSPDDPIARVSIRLPDDIGATTVPVRLTVTSTDSGRVVVKDSGQARLTEQHPNGASCAPTAWTATFRADPVEGLTSAEGMSLQTK